MRILGFARRASERNTHAAVFALFVFQLCAVVQAVALQFLHALTPNLSRFFICRHLSCMYFGANVSWAINGNQMKYRCPMCGQQYRPGQTKQQYLAANHVYVLQRQGVQWLVLAVWPETAVENWITQVQETYAGLTPEDGLKSLEELFEEFQMAVLKWGIPSEFKELSITSTARWVLEDAKKNQPHEDWRWDHLESGFMGCN
jgi:hypothetical protein